LPESVVGGAACTPYCKRRACTSNSPKALIWISGEIFFIICFGKCSRYVEPRRTNRQAKIVADKRLSRGLGRCAQNKKTERRVFGPARGPATQNPPPIMVLNRISGAEAQRSNRSYAATQFSPRRTRRARSKTVRMGAVHSKHGLKTFASLAASFTEYRVLASMPKLQ
jgi:hypothetical protein